MKTPKYLFLLLIAILSSLSVFSQNTDDNNKLTFKLGYSTMFASSIDHFNSMNYISIESKPNFRISANYALTRSVDVGVYLGYSRLYHQFELPYNPVNKVYELYSNDGKRHISNYYPVSRYDTNAFSYGLRSEVHLLPLFLKKQNARIDAYLSPTVGFVSESYKDINEQIISKPTFFEYGVGFGVNYYFTPHIGVFGEYALGRFYNHGKIKFLVGVALKF